MGLVRCPDCGSEVSTKAKVCPSCGRGLRISMGKEWSTLEPKEKLVVHSGFIVVSLILAWVVLFGVDLLTDDVGFIWSLVQHLYWLIFGLLALGFWKGLLDAFNRGELNG